IKSFNGRGLEDFSISRLKEKMPWGVPVPGDENHVMYVWFDALVGYISALGWPENTEQFNAFWPGLQMAGKDNLRQQSSMWQAMLMSAGLPNAKQIFIHGFITANGQKMSKSLGNVVDPFGLVKKYGTDAVRYYLLREFSGTEDGDFTQEKFEQRYNADLAGGIGNLLSRTLTLAQKMTVNAAVPAEAMQKAIAITRQKTSKHLESFAFNESLKSIWELVSYCDKFLNEEKPWEGGENAPRAVGEVMTALSAIGELLSPFLPETAERIIHTVADRKPKALFPRLTSLI
ncbi:MAG: methionine--tRNA ligase, partial [Candidatus Saccharimonadales bacterium]